MIDLPGWQCIPGDILLIIMEISSYLHFLTTQPLDELGVNVPPSVKIREGYPCFSQERRDIDRGIAPIFAVCKHWNQVACSGPLRPKVIAYSVSIPRYSAGCLPFFPERYAELMKESSQEFQVDFRLTCHSGRSSYITIHSLLTIVAPFIRRLSVEARVPSSPNSLSSSSSSSTESLILTATPQTTESTRHQQLGTLPTDESIPHYTLQFPKLLEFRAIRYPFLPFSSILETPKLLRLRLNQSDLIKFPDFNPSELYVNVHRSIQLQPLFLVGMAEYLTYLDLKPPWNVPIDIDLFSQLGTDELQFPFLECLVLHLLEGYISLSTMIGVLHAPNLQSLSVGFRRHQYKNAGTHDVRDLSKFPRMVRLVFSGQLCASVCFWLARSDSCPNLRTLWICGKTNWKPAVFEFECRESTCKAKTLFIVLEAFLARHSLGVDVSPMLLAPVFSILSSIHLPNVISIRLEVNATARNLLTSTRLWLSKVNMPSLKWLIVGSNEARFAELVGRSYNEGDLTAYQVTAGSTPELAAVSFSLLNQPPSPMKSNHRAKTAIINLGRTSWTTDVPSFIRELLPETIIFRLKDYNGEESYLLKELAAWFDVLHCVDRSHRRYRAKAILRSLRDAVKRPWSRKNLVAQPRGNHEGSTKCPLSSLTRLVLLVQPPSDGELPFRHRTLNKPIVQALKRLVACSDNKLSRIDSVFLLDKEEDRTWFTERGVSWYDITDAKSEIDYEPYLPGAPMGVRNILFPHVLKEETKRDGGRLCQY